MSEPWYSIILIFKTQLLVLKPGNRVEGTAIFVQAYCKYQSKWECLLLSWFMNNGIATERRSDFRSELSLEYLTMSTLIERYKAAFLMSVSFLPSFAVWHGHSVHSSLIINL